MNLKNGKITVFGGEQTRPNNTLRICQCISTLPTKSRIEQDVTTLIENLKIGDIAKRVKERTGAEIVITESNDLVLTDKIQANYYQPDLNQIWCRMP